jgi:hypothetical protein
MGKEIGININHIVSWELTDEIFILRMVSGITYQFEGDYFQLHDVLTDHSLLV